MTPTQTISKVDQDDGEIVGELGCGMDGESGRESKVEVGGIHSKRFTPKQQWRK